ncbi:MAG TPA: hypothetical protein VF122_04605 [Caulobacteraceae bacterium]
MAGPKRRTSGFEDRRRSAESRIARLNRADMADDDPVLEGPGSEARLNRLRDKFRSTGVGGRARRAASGKPDRGKLGMAIWLTVWATCVGLAAAVFLATR